MNKRHINIQTETPKKCPACGSPRDDQWPEVVWPTGLKAWVECMNPSCHMIGPEGYGDIGAVKNWNRIYLLEK